MRRSLLALLLCSFASSSAMAQAPSLALPMLEVAAPAGEKRSAADVPRDWIAQRAITRAWGASEDSIYTEVQVPDWKSEPLAMLASAILPGAGQLYVGEGSGWYFLAGEAACWTLRALSIRKADDRENEFVAQLGDPQDGASGWSFERYQNATGGDVSWLETLWAADRGAYYLALARDRSLTAGFSGDPQASFDTYRALREKREDALSRARTMEMLIVIDHLVSAWDALRAARFHNLPLRRSLPVQLGAEWRDGEPVVTAAWVRRL